MAIHTNPFLERVSDPTTSDLDFVRLFSPKILEKLEENAFKGGVHIFRSAPGAGKTTLLRVFTPVALRGFWNARRSEELHESFRKLVDLEVLSNQEGPRFLGVLLSCASGYADLPPGADIKQESLFRALFDCRIVLRTLRSVQSLVGPNIAGDLSSLRLTYESEAADLKSIPRVPDAQKLVQWAEKQEQRVYAQLDALGGQSTSDIPSHLQFEGPIWLQAVRFHVDGESVAPKRLLMIDDLHKLRRKQRALLIDELTIQRPAIPVWLAERSIALGDELLSQGARSGRDVSEYSLEEMWSGPKGASQFSSFAENILQRRMATQDIVPSHSFSQCLRETFDPGESRAEIEMGIEKFRADVKRHAGSIRYSTWLKNAEHHTRELTVDGLMDLYVTRILISRDEGKRQMTLDLPLPSQELSDRDSSQVRAAAEIFIHEELGVPYYFGLERLCVMATSNIDELLSLAAALYVGIQNKQVLRKPLHLSPSEQERLLKQAAKEKLDFVPKNHTEGLRAQRLLDAIGTFCREKTFLPNAPYAPGVTGVRLSQYELANLGSSAVPGRERSSVLKRVLSECAAENLLVAKPSAASTAREAGTIFYLNRTLCAHYDLPLQQGGWQEILARDLIDWMERGLKPSRNSRLKID